VQVLEEMGIKHIGVSKNVHQFRGDYFKIVIFVCDSAAEACPTWLGSGKRTQISVLDPAKAG